jgi:hypothetical protein
MKTTKTLLTAAAAAALAIAGLVSASTPAGAGTATAWMTSTSTVQKSPGEDVTARYASAIWNDGWDGKSPLLLLSDTFTATYQASAGVTFKPGATISVAYTPATACSVTAKKVVCTLPLTSVRHGLQIDVLLPASVDSTATRGSIQAITQEYHTSYADLGWTPGPVTSLYNILVK